MDKEKEGLFRVPEGGYDTMNGEDKDRLFRVWLRQDVRRLLGPT